MPTQWDEFEAVDEQKPEVDWNEFEPAKEPSPLPTSPVTGQPWTVSPDQPKIKLSPYQEAELSAFQQGKGKPQTEQERTTQFTETVARAGQEALGRVTAPMVEIMGKFSPAQIERFLQLSSPSMTAALARERAVGGEPLQNVIPPEERKTIAKGVGTWNAIADQVNFFSSPLGVSTLGIGALPKSLQTAVSVAFAAQMAQGASEVSKELGAELGKNPEDQDPEKIAYLTTTGIAQLGFTGLGTSHALTKLRVPEYLDIMTDKGIPSKAIIESARQTAWETTDPRYAQLRANRIPMAKNALVTQPNEMFPEPSDLARERMDREALTPEGRLEADRQRELRHFQDQLNRIKPEKPTVPTSEETEWLGLTGEILKKPEAAPAKELATFDDFVADLKQRGNPDMTIPQVQEMYPSIFKGNANRQGARFLLQEAFGKKPAPAPAPAEETVALYHGEGGTGGAGFGGAHVAESHPYAATFGPNQSVVNVPRSVFEKMKAEAVSRGQPNDLILPKEWINKLAPVEKPITPPVHEVEALGAADWLEQQFSDPKVRPSNITSKDAGMRVKSIDDISKLAEMRVKYMEESKRLIEESRNLPADQKIAALTKSAQVVNRAQLTREAIETATNIGGWAEGVDTKIGDRPMDWKKNPEIAKWLKENAARLDISLPEELSGKKVEAAAEPQTVPSLLEHPPIEIPASEIAAKADLMQFRQGALETGETVKDKLSGKWDELKSGLLLLWEPKNPAEYGLKEGQKYIVANGHHRFAFGKTQGVKAHAAQVLREADGFSAQDARRIAAEANIADGKGTIHDQVKYLRNVEGSRSPDEQMAARERIGGKGRQAATIAFDASNDVYTSFINERITPEQAEAIAKAAPKNEAAQAVGLAMAEKVKDPQSLEALVKRYLDEKPVVTGETPDMFMDDSAVKKMVAEEAKAEKFREEIRDRINAIRGAGKRVDIAKSEGVDVKDSEAIGKRVEFLKGELDRWREWWKHNDLAEKIRGVPVKPTVPPVISPTPEPAPVVKPPTGAPEPSGEAPTPAPAQPAPQPQPAPVPTAGAPIPAPVGPPSGHFGKSEREAARERLRKKLEKKQATEKLVIRPQAEIEERYQAADAGTPELFPGEREDVTPLFEQSTLMDLTTEAGALIEEGFIPYPIWFKKMMEFPGPELKHYFRRAYNQVRDISTVSRAARDLMTPRQEVELYDDNGIKVGKGANRRPGLVEVSGELVPDVEEIVTPRTFVGREGDSIDWTQSKAVNLIVAARKALKGGMMIADGPGVGKSGIGAMAAHLLTFAPRIKLDARMGELWAEASPEARARWLLQKMPVELGEMPKAPKDLGETLMPDELDRMRGTVDPEDIGETPPSPVLLPERVFSPAELDRMANLKWENVRPEQRTKVYRNYGFSQKQIEENNVNADVPRGRVLIVGVNKQQLETAFKPDFEKFGIPFENIDFITYADLSDPGAPGSPRKARFDKMMAQDWNAVIFDEAQALKNAGSGREHNSRKLKTPFKVFMTATPMDNIPNAIYFFSEITGKNRFQIMDQLGLQRIVKTVGGEDREYVVQKPGISHQDVLEQIKKLRDQAISNGAMIRREFPWWGDVIGRDREVSLYIDMQERWNTANKVQKADWTMPQIWENWSPEERARNLIGSVPPELGQMPKPGEQPRDLGERLMASEEFPKQELPQRKFTPEELAQMEKTTWDNLRPEQKEKIFTKREHLFDKWESIPDAMKETIYRNADYTPKELESGIRVKKGNKGPYYLEGLDHTELAEQQQIFNKWQEAIDKSRNPMTRMFLNGQRKQELKRWAEQIKAKKSVAIVLKELEAGRNVVIYGNTVNDHYVKGLGASTWPDVRTDPPTPNKDWPKYPGGVGVIVKELKRLNIPFSQIFGAVKDVKTHGIREFYNNRNRVAVVTTKSGGAGLNLDDVMGRHPRTLIITDIDWAGDMFEQVMYRVSRRNTASESKAHILLMDNAFSDADIIRKMDKKLKILRGIQSGKDTDLMAFLDDLNNPETTGHQSNANTNLDPTVGKMPPLEWQEVRGRTGRIRWKAIADEPFMKWYHENGGDEKPPFGLKRVFKDHKQEIWTDSDPNKIMQAQDGVEDRIMGIDDPAYPDPQPAKFTWTPHDALIDDIEAVQNLISKGVDVDRNTSMLNEMKGELNRLTELDERTDLLLADNPEYQDVLRKMTDMPDHPNYPEWEFQRGQLTREAYGEVFDTIPEPQAATTGPNVVPAAVTPPSLVGNMKSMDQISRMLRKGLGIPIRYKSWRGGGFYDTLADYIRVKNPSDYPASFHEAGHKIDAMFQLWKEPKLLNELSHLGDYDRPGSRSSWRPGKSVRYRLGEGVAEFVRYWIFEPTTAADLAPNMIKFWDNLIDANEKSLGFMRKLKKEVEIFRQSPLEAQFNSKIVSTNPKHDHLTTDSLISSVIDDLHFIRLASNEAFRTTKGNLPPEKDPYILYRLLRGNYGRADAFLRYGTIDPVTGDVRLGTSLVDATKGVRGEIKEFNSWIAAVQAAEMHRKGQESGFTPQEINAVLKNHSQKKNFQEAFQKSQVWQDSLLVYAREMGLFSMTDYLRMKKENAIYVPMHRMYEVGIGEEQVFGGSGTGSQKGKVGTPGSLKSRGGSTRPLINPLQSMVENAYFLTFAAEKQRALLALADLSKLPGMGKWITEYGIQPREKVQFQAGRIKKQLEDAGVNVSQLTDDTLLWFWRNAKNPVLKDNVIRVKRGDTFEYYQLNPDLFKATMAMDKFSFDKFMKVMAYPSQILRTGVTLEPTFTIRNIIRDTISSAIISKYTHVPFEAAIRGVLAQLPESVYKFFGAKNPEDFTTRIMAEWKASGGEHSVEAAYFDRDKMQEYIKHQILNDRTWKERGLFIAKNPLVALRAVAQFGEQSTRIGEYQNVFHRLIKEGWSRKNAHLQAAYESRDLQDFAMSGASTTIKGLKYLTAFWNAGLQGRYRFFRSLADSRKPDAWKSVFLKGFGWITMAKMMEQYINWDDDKYWNQPRWQRMLFFHVPIKRGTPDQRFILIPVPFEAGIVFASLPGSIMELFKQKNMDSASTFGKMFAGQMVDNPVPQWLTTAMELIPEMGYDYYQKRNILPRGMENEPYWARATDTASLAARKAGKILNISPSKIEHAIRRTTGGLGTVATHHIIDPMLETEKLKGAPKPFTSTRMLITDAPGIRSQVIDDFYRKLEILKQENVSRNKYHEVNKKINISELSDMLAAEKQMAELRKQVKGSYDNARREKISLQIEKLAKQFVRKKDGTYKGYEVKR